MGGPESLSWDRDCQNGTTLWGMTKPSAASHGLRYDLSAPDGKSMLAKTSLGQSFDALRNSGGFAVRTSGFAARINRIDCHGLRAHIGGGTAKPFPIQFHVSPRRKKRDLSFCDQA